MITLRFFVYHNSKLYIWIVRKRKHNRISAEPLMWLQWPYLSSLPPNCIVFSFDIATTRPSPSVKRSRNSHCWWYFLSLFPECFLFTVFVEICKQTIITTQTRFICLASNNKTINAARYNTAIPVSCPQWGPTVNTVVSVYSVRSVCTLKQIVCSAMEQTVNNNLPMPFVSYELMNVWMLF